MTKLRSLYYIVFIILINLGSHTVTANEQHIYLARHAEKLIAIKDPELTSKGKARAQWLGNFLIDKSIEQIYSTDTQRTRQTAAPLATLSKQTTILYDANKLADFAKHLLREGKNCFVSGHSNTTPQLVRLLKGEPGDEMTDTDYDRLYHLVIYDNGTVTTEEIKSQSSSH